MARNAKREFPVDLTGTGSLGDQVETLSTRLFKVIRDSVRIHEFGFDPEMTSELQYNVSLGYLDSPDLRITWLENLARFQAQKGNIEELAQAKIHIAALIVECLNLNPSETPTGIPRSIEEFVALSPSITGEPGLPDVSQAGEEGLFNSNLFTEEGLIKTLNEIISVRSCDEWRWRQVYDSESYTTATTSTTTTSTTTITSYCDRLLVYL